MVANIKLIRRMGICGAILLVLSGVVAFVFHVQWSLGGIGPASAAAAYVEMHLTSKKNEFMFNLAFKEAVARNLFLRTQNFEIDYLTWQKVYDSRFDRLQRRLCNRSDVISGAEERVPNIFEIACIPVINPRPEACGWIMRPTCRTLGIHKTIWQDEELRAKIFEALRRPCKYVRGKAFLEYWEAQGDNRLRLPLKPVARTLHGARYWAGCTGAVPEVTEFRIFVGDEIDGSFDAHTFLKFSEVDEFAVGGR